MKRVLCPEIPRPGKIVQLPEAEAQHATRVLRLRDGDLVQALDGKGGTTLARLKTRAGEVLLEAEEGSGPAAGTADILPIVLEMAVLKGDAMEWVIEKAVELGISKVVPLVTDHCVVQLKNKGPEAFRERWQKIADQALKQCGRLVKLEIDLPRELREHVTHALPSGARRLWCDEAAAGGSKEPKAGGSNALLLDEALGTGTSSTIHLLVGPEGGWSAPERELLASPATPATTCVGLGPRILRAETAAIFGMSILSGVFQRKGS